MEIHVTTNLSPLQKVNEVDIDSAIDGMATITVMDASAKADLEANKDSLKSYDYAGIKTTVNDACEYDLLSLIP